MSPPSRRVHHHLDRPDGSRPEGADQPILCSAAAAVLTNRADRGTVPGVRCPGTRESGSALPVRCRSRGASRSPDGGGAGRLRRERAGWPMLRLVSANVTGSGRGRRGGLDVAGRRAGRRVCLQEVRASDAQLREAWATAAGGLARRARPRRAEPAAAGVAVVTRTPSPCAWASGRGVRRHGALGRGRPADGGRPADRRVGLRAHREAGTERQDEKYAFLDAIDDGWASCGRARAARRGDRRPERRAPRGRHQELEGQPRQGRVPRASAPTSTAGSTSSDWVDVDRALRREGRGRTRGGPGAGRRSTTTPAGASTTSSPRPPWPAAPSRPRWAARRRTPSGGATTRRCRSTTTSEPLVGPRAARGRRPARPSRPCPSGRS